MDTRIGMSCFNPAFKRFVPREKRYHWLSCRVDLLLCKRKKECITSVCEVYDVALPVLFFFLTYKNMNDCMPERSDISSRVK